MVEVPQKKDKEGLKFAQLENLVLDKREKNQVLSKAERRWMLEHLNRIDAKGYKEYTFLKRVFGELKRGNTNLAAWLEHDRNFNDYIESRSTRKKGTKEFQEQVKNIATMFAQSKIALLRELNAIKNKRRDYTVIGDINVKEVRT